MRRFRFSIAGGMAAILLAGVGFAALRSAAMLWACGLYTAAALAVLVAIRGALVKRGARRASWLGFAILGGGYFLLAFGPLPSGGCSDTEVFSLIQQGKVPLEVEPHLVTTRLFEQLNEHLTPKPPSSVQEVQVWEWGDLGPKKTYLTYIYLRLQATRFQWSAHALTCLALGLIGAVLGRWLADREPPRGAADPAPPPPPPG